MEKKRASLSKRTRFSVFERDSFTCQYCGRKPPDVLLELDHIHPVSEGGQDVEENLTTSCEDCNRGKSARILGAVVPSPEIDSKYLKIQQETAEMKRYMESKKELDRCIGLASEDLLKLFRECSPRYATEPVPGLLYSWITDFGIEEAEIAIRLAGQIGESKRFQGRSGFVKYICGILRNRRSLGGQ